ncbi:hypothetical protein ACVIU7_004103 [Bradyrhizobium liaoningense]|uniref:hypothetical protein n=1 Tax=Bradyrhizobium TaxID=374 RepID=UPI0024E18C1E|nr:hypothetical protein [Bradyrhizobium liaoningense]WLB87453.1 hypothetical protein QIH91_32540 [Bradyrhizobium japonicum USDA 135]
MGEKRTASTHLTRMMDVSCPIEKAATIFIPKNAWHGFTTPDNELLLLWVTALAGLDGFLRKTEQAARRCYDREPPDTSRCAGRRP